MALTRGRGGGGGGGGGAEGVWICHTDSYMYDSSRLLRAHVYFTGDCFHKNFWLLHSIVRLSRDIN